MSLTTALFPTLVLVVAFALAAALVPVATRLARRHGVLDDPGPRKVHAAPTPRIGGIAVWAAFSVVVLTGYLGVPLIAGLPWVATNLAGPIAMLQEAYRVETKLLAMMLGGAIAFGVGLLDDVLGEPLQGRLQARGPGAGGGRAGVGRDPHRHRFLRAAQRRDHDPVGGGDHERLQPARQHGRALRRRRLRGLAGAAAQRVAARRVLHQPGAGRVHGKPARLPRLQLAPGLDLPRRLREPLHRLHARRAHAAAALRVARLGHPASRC